MKKYRFRLETLLKLREADRQQRRAELAQALHAERLLQEQADALALELAQARHTARNSAAPGEVNVDKLLELQRYALQLVAQTQVLGTQRSRVSEETERRRQALIEADRQVRTLEKLRSKQEDAFRSHELRVEQKGLDEVANRAAVARVRANRD